MDGEDLCGYVCVRDVPRNERLLSRRSSPTGRRSRGCCGLGVLGPSTAFLPRSSCNCVGCARRPSGSRKVSGGWSTKNLKPSSLALLKWFSSIVGGNLRVGRRTDLCSIQEG